MNFAQNKNLFIYNFVNPNVKKTKKDSKDKENSQNSFNQAILDSIIDDDADKFSELVVQAGDEYDLNQTFSMTNYKFPQIMRNKPSYASLCAYFSAEKCLDILEMLVPAGLESEQMQKMDEFGRSPIHFACAGGSLNIIRKLDQAKYSFDITDKEGCLPSHYSAMAGHLDVIKYLWTKGADLLSRSNLIASMTPLHVACLYGYLDIVKFICETVMGDDDENNSNNDDQNNKDNNYNQNTNLNKRLNFGHFHRFFCNKSTPLHLACEGGHADVLNYLLSKKDLVAIQINRLDRSSRTPLLVACQNGSLECVKSLIKTGKVQLYQKKRKHLPLVDAAAAGHIDIVKFLINQPGIKIDSENSQRIDAISAAVINNNIDIVKCLANHKALSKYDNAKIGSLFTSALKTDNMKLIKYLDSICQIPYSETSNNRVHYWSCTHNMHMDGNLSWGTQYMQQACMLENEEMVEFLLNRKVTFENIDFSINIKSKWGPFMDFLLDKGVDLSECMNSQGVPPIVAAIKQGNLANVKKLVSKGAKLDRDIIMNNNLISDVCSIGKEDLFDFLMTFNPEINYGEKCIELCLFSYNQRNLQQRQNIAEKILKGGFADLNKPYNKSNNENLVSQAVEHKSLHFLDIFAKYGADFENVPLRYDMLSLQSNMPVFTYLAEHGCKFRNMVKFDNYSRFHRNKFETPLEQSFYQMHNFDFDVNIPLFLIDYIDDKEIEKIKNGDEDIVDNLLLLNCYDGILKLFRKCNCVVFPNSQRDDFLKRIESSGNQELIDFVREYNEK